MFYRIRYLYFKNPEEKGMELRTFDVFFRRKSSGKRGFINNRGGFISWSAVGWNTPTGYTEASDDAG